MTHKVTKITVEAPSICALGEGLFIHADNANNGLPSWVDIAEQMVFWRGQAMRLEHDIPSIIFAEDTARDTQRLLIGTHRGIKWLQRDGALQDVLTLPHHNSADFRLNDGCQLQDGTFLVGSMSRHNAKHHAGQIYHFALDGAVTCFDWPCHIPNSFIELPDKTILISDSLRQIIFRVQIDGTKLTATQWYRAPKTPDSKTYNPKEYDQAIQTPDGGCLLPDGRVAVAIWDGACIRLFNQRGAVLEDIAVPPIRPTNCKFDAPTGKLYVTSATLDLSAKLLKTYPQSGCLFSIVIS